MPARHAKKPAARKPPAALAARAVAVAEKARDVNAVRARELVALVRDKLQTAAAAFYDIGVALGQLDDPALYAALGYRSFGALLKTELGISREWARQMMGVARGMKRSTALKLGLTRAVAVLSLTAATPEDDTPEQVANGKVTVRGHRTPVRPAQMSAREIERAAKTERRSHRAAAKAGGDDDAARVAKIEARLRKRDPDATAALVSKRAKGRSPTALVRVTMTLAAWEALFGR
jgi:hypothetical protein